MFTILKIKRRLFMAFLQPMHNQSLDFNSSGGGSVRVTSTGDNSAVQANAGTSQPCRSCLIVLDASASGTARVDIGAACTSTTGIPVTKAGSTNITYLSIPVDDVSLLYFFFTKNADVLDILWRT
jgi:hypothetical protein